MPDRIPVQTALMSVSDRRGLAEFARALVDAGVRIIATDSTAAHLTENGIETTPVAEITGFPEMLDGRVKTLHPHIHGGLLADRDKPEHLATLEERGIPRIDLVVCNLYPFRETLRSGADEKAIIEKIDIGGPSMVRAAAKNHSGVAIVVSPDRYSEIVEAVKAGGTSLELRRSLAADAFALTASYDAAVSGWMQRDETFPARTTLALERVGGPLRYGENPHQAGALYREQDADLATLANAECLQGKELSYNNYLDIDAALLAAFDFTDPACVIVKHAVPCGLAVGSDLTDAYVRALACDRLSAFGSVVAYNGMVTGEVADAMAEVFTECVIAIDYDEAALARFGEKKNLRVLRLGDSPDLAREMMYRRINGGFIAQTPDQLDEPQGQMKVVTKAQPTDRQWRDLLFAWKACKHVRSNAIVLAKDGATVGIGGGQVSRVDAADIAAKKAGSRAKGSVMASDAFFPFRDGLDAGAAAGAVAVIQPGGSMRDDEIVAAADEHGIAMVFTGVRHFRHG
ncbi:MAG: bifunctional phosphoribosylaminoimidazolecarboxamide formyltransferase/IMP cyclohydrolase [Actinomycetota bacterium]